MAAIRNKTEGRASAPAREKRQARIAVLVERQVRLGRSGVDRRGAGRQMEVRGRAHEQRVFDDVVRVAVDRERQGVDIVRRVETDSVPVTASPRWACC